MLGITKHDLAAFQCRTQLSRDLGLKGFELILDITKTPLRDISRSLCWTTLVLDRPCEAATGV